MGSVLVPTWVTRLAWWTFAVASLAAFVTITYQTAAAGAYRIDADVYRQGAQTWLDGRQLYGDTEFTTAFPDYLLPFTYPPIAAMLFSPMTWTSLQTASTVVTVVTAVLFVVCTAIVLAGLGVWRSAGRGFGPAWVRLGCLSAAVVAVVLWLDLEPVAHNIACGQINVVLMTLVLCDCVPARTVWPRGLLVGVAIAVKLTPAVFLLYFVLRRDWRAVFTAMGTFAALVAVAFVVAPRDSWEYWTDAVRRTNRIGDASRERNQSLAGMLARLGFSEWSHTALWVTACVAALALAVWAARRQLGDGGTPVLALMCVAVLGLLVSPVSWSHHWVWGVTVIVALVAAGALRRNPYLVVLALVGLALMRWVSLTDKVVNGDLVRQLGSSSYVWWGLAVLVAIGLSTAPTPTGTLARL